MSLQLRSDSVFTEALVTEDGAPSKLEVKGPSQLEADEKAKKMGVSGGGEVKTSDVYTYL